MTMHDQTSLRAEWARSPELRVEFGDFDCYAAFMRASDRGLVKIFSRPKTAHVGGIVGPRAGDDPRDGAILAAASQRWKTDPALRAEFGNDPAGYVRYSEWVCREGRRAAQ